MRQKAYFLIVLIILTGILLPNASALAYTGVISVDTVEALPGEQLGVPVRLSANDEPISGLVIPLKYSSLYLSVDSISFMGSILPSDFSDQAFFDNNSEIIKFSYIPHFVNPIPAITTTGGVLATIFVSVSSLATPGTAIPIDSINKDSIVYFNSTETHVLTRIEATDNTGTILLLPDFIFGAVVVKSPTGIDDGVEPSGLPSAFNLSQNYPNPFNPSTVIGFALPRASHVKLEVFNILGQSVMTLVDRQLPAGNHQVTFEGAGFPSGIYFYRLDYNGGNLTRKMTLVK